MISLYSEHTILPLITQIKAIFDSEIVDFAIMDQAGYRYNYAEFLLQHTFSVVNTTTDLTRTNHKYKDCYIDAHFTVVFYDLKDTYLIVTFEDEINKDIDYNAIHKRLLSLSFFRNHLDLYTKENTQDDQYAMIIMDFNGKIQLMNHYAKTIFKNSYETIRDFLDVIESKDVFTSNYKKAVNNHEGASFETTTKSNQILNTVMIVEPKLSIIQFVFTYQPAQSFYNQILEAFDFLKLGIVHFELIFDDQDNPIDAQVLFANKQYGTLMNEPINKMIGKTIYEIYPNFPDNRFNRYASVAIENKRNAFEDYNRRLDKHFHIFSYAPKYGEIINVYHETTHYNRMKAKERVQLRKIQMMLSLAEMGFFEIDIAHKTFTGDDYVKRIFNQSDLDYDSYRHIFRDYLHQDDYASIYSKNRDLMTGKIKEGTSVFRLMLPHQDTPKYIQYYLQTLDTNDDGTPKRILGLVREVTEEQKKNQQITYMANHDALTGVYNRRHVETMTNTIIDNNTLAIFDLDGLKSINDIFGHIEGDRVIKTFANILNKTYPNCYIARIGGDEFLILINDEVNNIKYRENIIKKELKHILPIDLSMGVSVGYAQINHDTNYKTAFEKAEEMMYRHKLRQRPKRKQQSLSTLVAYLFKREPVLKKRIERLKTYSDSFMQALGFTRMRDLEMMHDVCYYHAIGRLYDYTQDKVIKLPVPLDKLHEYFHVELGYKIMSNLLSDETIANAVLYQCEAYDGSGYPHGLKGDAIPYQARIFAILSRFDYLTRCKRTEILMTDQEALAQLQKESGTYFDPEMVDIFTTLFT